MFSRETFLVSRNADLQLGHLSILDLQLRQILWPLAHNVMGGVMYSVQMGHSSSLRTLSLKPRNSSVISEGPCSEKRIFEMVRLRKYLFSGEGGIFKIKFKINKGKINRVLN